MIIRENEPGEPCFVIITKGRKNTWYQYKRDLMFHVVDDGVGYYYGTDPRTSMKQYINYSDAVLLEWEV